MNSKELLTFDKDIINDKHLIDFFDTANYKELSKKDLDSFVDKFGDTLFYNRKFSFLYLFMASKEALKAETQLKLFISAILLVISIICSVLFISL